MSNVDSILELVRQSVERVTRNNYKDFDPEAPLNLDSINRISLIVELENTFQVELDSAEAPPEIFHSLATLASFIANLR